jgi:hypothetical protein
MKLAFLTLALLISNAFAADIVTTEGKHVKILQVSIQDSNNSYIYYGPGQAIQLTGEQAAKAGFNLLDLGAALTKSNVDLWISSSLDKYGTLPREVKSFQIEFKAQ